jgi:hypothetical protein
VCVDAARRADAEGHGQPPPDPRSPSRP